MKRVIVGNADEYIRNGFSTITVREFSDGYVSHNRHIFFAREFFLDFELIVVKDTDEGRELSSRIEHGREIEDLLVGILLRNVDHITFADAIKEAIKDQARVSYESGRRDKMREIRMALGIETGEQ